MSKYKIAIFLNKDKKDKQPDLNAVLSPADDPQNKDKQIKFGLWQQTAKSGLKYYSGSAELPDGGDSGSGGEPFSDDIPFNKIGRESLF